MVHRAERIAKLRDLRAKCGSLQRVNIEAGLAPADQKSRLRDLRFSVRGVHDSLIQAGCFLTTDTTHLPLNPLKGTFNFLGVIIIFH